MGDFHGGRTLEMHMDVFFPCDIDRESRLYSNDRQITLHDLIAIYTVLFSSHFVGVIRRH